MMNKKGVSVGYVWIFGLVMLFGIGVLYVVFNQVFLAYLVPTIQTQVNSTEANIPESTRVEIHNNIDKYLDFFHVLPFILFFVVVIYMVLTALRKEGEAY